MSPEAQARAEALIGRSVAGGHRLEKLLDSDDESIAHKAVSTIFDRRYGKAPLAAEDNEAANDAISRIVAAGSPRALIDQHSTREVVELRFHTEDQRAYAEKLAGLGERLEVLPDMAIAARSSVANYEWLDAIDVMNMVEVCELIVHSSLERKESRGPFIRTDFPATDNRNWLVANVLKKSGNGLRFEQRPYQLPFFTPGFDVRDNLQVAW